MFAQVSYVYYGYKEDPWTFNRRDTDGSNTTLIYTPSTYMVYDAAMDPIIEKIYFHEKSGDDSWIYQANYDGTGKTTIKTSTARYNSMAAGDGYIFYAYQDDPWSVRRCDSTGANDIQVYLNPITGSIQNIAYDAENDYLYCYEYQYDNTNNRIFRIDKDGSNLTTVYNNCPSITSITAGAGYFYYQVNADPWNFSRRNSDGTSETLIYTPPTGLVQACAYDAFYDKLYFCDYDGVGNRYFYKADADGSNRTTFYSGLTRNIECIAAPCVNPSEVPLPIELTSFTAKALRGVVGLDWTTESETENSHFLIYRNSEVIGQMDGAGTTSEQHSYSFLDTQVPAGSHSYAIADVSYGGVEALHEAITVEVGEEIEEAYFVLNKAYPNPFNPTTVISMHYAVGSNAVLNIYNTQGVLVENLINGFLEAGHHDLIWNASDMTSGVYIVKMITGDIIQSQKLVLMK
jgi:uncharacterized protein DUF5050/type IX secretion system substrate protein